jgi:hypothetical protein
LLADQNLPREQQRRGGKECEEDPGVGRLAQVLGDEVDVDGRGRDEQ